jgi:WD40 repeat protein
MGKFSANHVLQGHEDRVWNVAWHPQGNLLASCGDDKTIYIWSRGESKWDFRAMLTEGEESKRTIRSLAWSPCGKLLATTSFDSTTGIWSIVESEDEYDSIVTMEGHESEVNCVAWSQSGQYLATCGRDKIVWIWETEEDNEYEYTFSAVLFNHTQDVKKVKYKV